MKKFKIATDQGIIQNEGETITIAGHQCFLSYNPFADDGWGEWAVTEQQSGMRIVSSFGSRDNVISMAGYLLINHSWFEIRQSNIKKLNSYGINFPVNT